MRPIPLVIFYPDMEILAASPECPSIVKVTADITTSKTIRPIGENGEVYKQYGDLFLIYE